MVVINAAMIAAAALPSSWPENAPARTRPRTPRWPHSPNPEGGADFRVQLSTDVPSLSLKSERGPKGDRYQVEITLISEKSGSVRRTANSFHEKAGVAIKK